MIIPNERSQGKPQHKDDGASVLPHREGYATVTRGTAEPVLNLSKDAVPRVKTEKQENVWSNSPY